LYFISILFYDLWVFQFCYVILLTSSLFLFIILCIYSASYLNYYQEMVRVHICSSVTSYIKQVITVSGVY
jgi:hypothetical protein